MKSFYRGRYVLVLLAVLAVLAGLSAIASRVAAQPPAGKWTITGTSARKWELMDQKVGVGDTVQWVIGGGGPHGVQFNDPEACKTAKDSLDFDPPLLEGCQTATKTKKGDVIVTATVKKALTAPLKYRCRVHHTMTGTLTP